MSSSSRKWAILVGIDFYLEHDRRLTGAVNDVDDIHFYLAKYHELHSLSKFVAADRHDPTQTEPDGLQSSWPTYNNISGELKRVSREASPGDLVYFHYSGHGALSPTTAREYQEDYGSDAALVLFDQYNKNRVRYMRGIELAAILDSMVQQGLKLTVVLDCCHVGSLSRGSTISVRSMPWDDEIATAYPPQCLPAPPYSSRSVRSINRDASTNQHWLLKPREYTLLAACGPTERVVECRGKDGRAHGALTYFLFKTLFMASAKAIEAALGDIYQQICAEMHVLLPNQHPMLLGNQSSMFLTAKVRAKSLEATNNVIDIRPDGRIWLNIGLAHSVCLGDEYAIFPLEDIGSRNVQDCPTYQIMAVHPFHSEAEQLRAPPEGTSVMKGWYAVLQKPARPRLQVSLDPGVDKYVVDFLSQSYWLEPIGSIDVVPDTLPSFQVRKIGNEYSIFIDSIQKVQNLPAIIGSDQSAARQVVLVLEHLAKFASIENLGNEDPSFSTPTQLDHRVKAKSIEKTQLSEFSIHLSSANDTGKTLVGNTLSVTDGEKITVSFENQTTDSLYLTVFDMRPSRGVVKLWPSSDRGYYKEIPPSSASFKGRISFKMQMSIPESLKKQGQSSVEDVLKFLITTQPTSSSFEVLELPDLSEDELRKKRHSSSDQPLLKFFEQRECLARFRGGASHKRTAGTDKWTCQNFVVRTEVAAEPY
ncbi:MAG: hypothetical protein M1821_007400 [Bathelium mastoideum]|nr:MAG: hypothetical protein M1821_007400 [Bathelium mastoideum]